MLRKGKQKQKGLGERFAGKRGGRKLRAFIREKEGAVLKEGTKVGGAKINRPASKKTRKGKWGEAYLQELKGPFTSNGNEPPRGEGQTQQTEGGEQKYRF